MNLFPFSFIGAAEMHDVQGASNPKVSTISGGQLMRIYVLLVVESLYSGSHYYELLSYWYTALYATISSTCLGTYCAMWTAERQKDPTVYANDGQLSPFASEVVLYYTIIDNDPHPS